MPLLPSPSPAGARTLRTRGAAGAGAGLAPTTISAPAEGVERRPVAHPTAAERVALYAALAVFVVHAINYLFFFVDDEGIPFVFARNLLHGRGLVYNSFEGRVEGYSDFLQVLLSAGWLWLTGALGFDRLTPFFLGKAVSFASGIGTVVVVWHAIRRTTPTVAGLGAGLVFLVTFAPLATWSCSSLEMAAVALLVATVMLGLLHDSPRWAALTGVAACALILERIDGFVFVGALVGPAFIAAAPERRRLLFRRTVFPVLAVLTVYHSWRVWYFGDWLTCPLEAKVLYKLLGTADIVTRKPSVPYLVAFLQQYGFMPALAFVAILAAASLRARRAWPLLASAIALVTYVAVVGDWMAGFRFLLPAAPVIAVLVAMAVSSIGASRLAWGVTVGLAVWFGAVALHISTEYDALEYRDSWWLHPSFDRRLYFGQYLRVYEDLAAIIGPGSVTAYNQAGFVPYMLDVENFDDLGICSRFVARMPTTDVVFTEVGRYSPLTNSTAVRAAHAYVMYRNPEFIVEPLDNLRSANGGRIPAAVLRNHYMLLFTDPHAQAAVYRRADGPADEFRTTPHAFLENLATPSRIVRAFDGADVPRGERVHRLAFLADGTVERTFRGGVDFDVVFATSDLPVYELDLGGAWARTPVRMAVTLRDASGHAVAHDERTIGPTVPGNVMLSWPAGVQASELELHLDADSAAPTRVMLTDLRVQGQAPALAEHVAQLSFPPAR